MKLTEAQIEAMREESRLAEKALERCRQRMKRGNPTLDLAATVVEAMAVEEGRKVAADRAIESGLQGIANYMRAILTHEAVGECEMAKIAGAVYVLNVLTQ